MIRTRNDRYWNKYNPLQIATDLKGVLFHNSFQNVFQNRSNIKVP